MPSMTRFSRRSSTGLSITEQGGGSAMALSSLANRTRSWLPDIGIHLAPGIVAVEGHAVSVRQLHVRDDGVRHGSTQRLACLGNRSAGCDAVAPSQHVLENFATLFDVVFYQQDVRCHRLGSFWCGGRRV